MLCGPGASSMENQVRLFLTRLALVTANAAQFAVVFGERAKSIPVMEGMRDE